MSLVRIEPELQQNDSPTNTILPEKESVIVKLVEEEESVIVKLVWKTTASNDV
jgi:hypothetical protein